MLQKLWCWIVGSRCKFQVIDVMQRREVKEGAFGTSKKEYFRYISRCTTCGLIKMKDV